MKVKIVDSAIKHMDHKMGGLEFDYNTPDYHDPIIVFTDQWIPNVECYGHLPGKKVAWLIEPEIIMPASYRFVRKYYSRFDLICSHDEDLLRYLERQIQSRSTLAHVPLDGIWIKPEDRILYSKTKHVSTIFSSKKNTAAQCMRHVIAKNFTVDLYGSGHSRMDYKLDGLKDYRYSIVVENDKREGYFTEKILDCFVTGTIPIYYGCHDINDFFDERGIIQFTTLTELSSILYDLHNNGIKYYNNNDGSLIANFQAAQEYDHWNHLEKVLHDKFESR